MVKHPGFTLVAALSLALGIGANTAIFSIINAVVLRPLAFRDPGRLVWIWESAPKLGLPEFSVSAANYLDWRAQSRSLEDVAAMTTAGFNLTGYQEPERISGLRVSHNLPSMLGVKPLLGRVFLPEEDRPGRDICGHDQPWIVAAEVRFRRLDRGPVHYARWPAGVHHRRPASRRRPLRHPGADYALRCVGAACSRPGRPPWQSLAVCDRPPGALGNAPCRPNRTGHHQREPGGRVSGNRMPAGARSWLHCTR